MNQITKFYLSSFLKNQTYFTPILIVFLQAQHLDFSQIFWVFTIGSIVSFVMEIPTGILADLFGKKRTVIVSKIFIFVSFVTFGFSETFFMFVLAQSLYEFGNSFRTGTEAAFIYDYLKQNKNTPKYTEVKGKQKFWARVGEAIATALGGVIAARLGYNIVFFAAAVPALGNLLNVILWENIKERRDSRFSFSEIKKHVTISAKALFKNKLTLTITANITIFTGVLAALEKFIQPYMQNAGISIEYFGFIYSASLILTALAVRYSYLVEDKFGSIKTINVLSLVAVLPAAIIGFKFVSMFGVVLFFLVLIIENIRSPIANSEFHKRVLSKERATLGSMLSQSKSLGKMIILPVAGYLAEALSLYSAVLILSGLLLINGSLFYFRKSKK